MKIEFDASKSEKNAKERGLAFDLAKQFDYDTALFRKDDRKDYGETRVIAYGYIENRLHVLCFKPVTAVHIRVISLRKANERERKLYEKQISKR